MANKYSRILLRGGTKKELESINPMLKEREPIVEYDTGRMKIGDGTHRYNSLNYVGVEESDITYHDNDDHTNNDDNK